MNILGRVRFPNSVDNLELYLQLPQNASAYYDECDRVIHLSQGDTLSFNTYFNSLYEIFYRQYTILSKVYYVLNLQGSFTLSLYRESKDSVKRQLLHCQSYSDCEFSDPIQFHLPELADVEAGRIYLELTCLSDRGLVKEGWIATDAAHRQAVKLGIISCTYKKEAYITKTVHTLLNDDALKDKSFDIFVVDNGQTLEQSVFSDHRVHLIPNRNLGGSGGFTRGLIEALRDESYTHFLFMDDDVELDSEVICKLFSLYEYAKSDFAIAGGMLDLQKRYLLFEAGAHYAKSQFKDAFEPFELCPLKTDLDLREPAALNTLLTEELIDYGAFWFFAFPREFVEEMGLPLPFFIKGDDIEFGLRISRQLQKRIISFPAIAVWHEPFYSKFPVWDSYYYFRNILVTHALHGTLSYFKAITDITVRLVYTLLFFDYNSAGMIVKGFEDYLKGPEFIKQHDPETYHIEVVKLSKRHPNQRIDYVSKPTQPTKVEYAGIVRRLVSLVTLNGHFLPDFLIRAEPALIWYAPGYPGQRSRAFARKRIQIFKEKMACTYEYEMDKQSSYKILLEWLKLAWLSCFRWASVTRAWKQSAKELGSLDFWHNYLHLS